MKFRHHENAGLGWYPAVKWDDEENTRHVLCSLDMVRRAQTLDQVSTRKSILLSISHFYIHYIL